MAKYQGAYRSDEESTLEEPSATPAEAAPDPDPGEDDSFKKRYGDLRRHMQNSLSEKDQELNKLRGQLDKATKSQIRFPKSEDEVAEWVSKYPDVAKIIDTIAQKRVLEGQQMLQKDMGKIKELETKLDKERAEKALRDQHPDFDKIRASREFHDWVALQPSSIQDALYKNSTDAVLASRCIDLYKSDKNKRKGSNSSAAQSVGRTSSASPNLGTKKFSESTVSKMSSAEYEKNESAILQSMRDGAFEYDLSAGAR